MVEFDELLGPDGAAAIVELCARFGRYGMYSQEHVESEIGKGLSQRHDAASNFVRTGGRYARNEPKAVLAARTNYFREEYAYGQQAADRAASSRISSTRASWKRRARSTDGR